MFNYLFIFFYLIFFSQYALAEEYYPDEEEIEDYIRQIDQEEEAFRNLRDSEFADYQRFKSPWTDPNSIAYQRPFTLTTEILGRTGTFSVNLDGSVRNYFAVGAGFFYLPQEIDDITFRALIIPVYGNIYSSRGEHRAFATVGMNYTKVSAEASSDTLTNDQQKNIVNGFYPTYGVGYEMRLGVGFVFRLTLYRIVLLGTFDTYMVGLSLGGSFSLERLTDLIRGEEAT